MERKKNAGRIADTALDFNDQNWKLNLTNFCFRILPEGHLNSDM